jgi:hypothetical protein
MVRNPSMVLKVATVLVAGVAACGGQPTSQSASSRAGSPVGECTSWTEGLTCDGFRLIYSGYGSVRASSGGVFELSPAPTAQRGQSHAALAVRDSASGPTDVSATLRTVQQLRRPAANPWEVAWLVWRYTDDSHFYSLILKPNGWEIGKEDPAYPGQQRFLATGRSPVFPVSGSYAVRVRQSGAAIRVDIPGLSIHVRDDDHPYTSGGLGLYTEDATVQFTHIRLAD